MGKIRESEVENFNKYVETSRENAIKAINEMKEEGKLTEAEAKQAIVDISEFNKHLADSKETFENLK